MLKVLLCCGAGFSSSALTQKMKNEIIGYGLDKDITIDFSPFALMKESVEHYDIVICCPHLRYEINSFFKKETLSIPLYILPPRMYGIMNVKEIYQDCKDIIEIYKQDKVNPTHFPGEENILKVTRFKAYNNK